MARGNPLLEKREKWGTPSFFGVRHELREDPGHPPEVLRRESSASRRTPLPQDDNLGRSDDRSLEGCVREITMDSIHLHFAQDDNSKKSQPLRMTKITSVSEVDGAPRLARPG